MQHFLTFYEQQQFNKAIHGEWINFQDWEAIVRDNLIGTFNYVLSSERTTPMKQPLGMIDHVFGTHFGDQWSLI